jgi:DnaJ family protein C protein 28
MSDSAQHRAWLRRLQAARDEQHLPPEVKKEGAQDAPRSEEERRSLVEQRIQEAMRRGEFDNLPGKGKPLNLDKNPYLDPSLEMAYRLLHNNALAPEWIERDKEIRRDLEQARARLRLAWHHYQQIQAEAGWPAAVARFEESLGKINRKIRDFNLIVPILSCHRPLLKLEDEVRRAQQDET